MSSLETDPASLHVLEVVGNAIVGGMERHVQMLVEGLLIQQFRVSALCPFESRFTTALRAAGCPVHIAMLEEALQWRSLLTATELIRRQQVDVVHSHLFNATFLTSLAGSLTGVPAAITIHGMNLSPEEAALARLTGAHLITVCTAANTVSLAMGLPDEQVSLIPNGVDTQYFRPEVDGTAFRQRLKLPDAAPLVGMVARLSREKGPDQFVRAAVAHPAIRARLAFFHRLSVHAAVVVRGLVRVTGGADRLRHIGRMRILLVPLVAPLARHVRMGAFGQLLCLSVAGAAGSGSLRV